MLRRCFVTVLAACGALAGCAGRPAPPADAVAVFDGGWVTPGDLAAASSGGRAGTLSLPGARGAGPEELARWIAWEKLVAQSRRSEVAGRREFLLRARQLGQDPLVTKLLAELSSTIQVSDQEIASEIQKIRASRAANGPRLELRYIFLRASDDRPAEERQRKLTLAQRLLAELRGGASFEALARQYSESATAANGGLITGLRPGMTDPAFEQVVFALQEGEVSEVITTASGYHIVRLEKRSGPEPINEQALRGQLPELLRSRKANQARAELVARLEQSEPHEARWNEAGVIDPRPGDGAILVVGDLVYTADDLSAARAQAGVALQRRDQVRAFLDGLLERELLAREAVRRFQPSRDELAAQHERAADAALTELAVRDEEAALAAAVPRTELERFATEQPAQLEVAATFRPQVIFLPDGKNVWETYREAERMVAELRAGGDFAALARARSAGPNPDLGGDLGLLTTNQLMAYDLEIVQLLGNLEVGAIAGPLHIADAKLSSQVGSMKGGFLIVKLVERREPHSLDLATDEPEVRKRFWAGHRAEILRQQRDQRLLGASFRLLAAAPAAAPTAVAGPPL